MDDILALREKSKQSVFHLLVMGCIISGKSSLINVLLGEKVLPTRAMPATALITEIFYGEQKRVIIYPKQGKWQGGDAPFEIHPSDIEKYCLINKGANKKEGNKIYTPFKKMVVYLPLPLLKDGISIIDLPGLNYTYSSNTIVEEYIPNADAIIFCVNGTQPYTRVDKEALESLNKYGFKSPIIVTTYFDQIRMYETSEGVEEYIKDINAHYFKHTNLGVKGSHFVDSREGLEGKISGEHSKLVNSGYYELESYLGTYLEKNRKDKLSEVLF